MAISRFLFTLAAVVAVVLFLPGLVLGSLGGDRADLGAVLQTIGALALLPLCVAALVVRAAARRRSRKR